MSCCSLSPSASSIIFTHRNIYTCTYVCVCTCTCVCIHIRCEVYIKGAWEMLHNDGFHQLMYGPATSRKMVSFASSYWLPRCRGSFWGSNGQAAVSDSRIQGPWSSRDITPLFWTWAVMWVPSHGAVRILFSCFLVIWTLAGSFLSLLNSLWKPSGPTIGHFRDSTELISSALVSMCYGFVILK